MFLSDNMAFCFDVKATVNISLFRKKRQKMKNYLFYYM